MGQVIDIMARHLFKMMFVAPSILLVIASMAPEVQSREPQLSDMSGVAPFDDTATASLADILASTQDALERYQNQESRYNPPYSSHRRTGSNTAGSGSGSGSGVITVEPTSAATSEPTDAPTVGPAGSGSGSGSGTASPTYAPSSEPTRAGSGSGSGSGSGTASPTYLPTSTPTAEPTPLATTPPDTGNAPTYEPTRAPTSPTAAPTLGVDEVMTMIVQLVELDVPFESALEMMADLGYMTMIEMGYAQLMGLTETIEDPITQLMVIQYLEGVIMDTRVDDKRRAAVGVTYSTQVSSTSNVNLAQAQAGVTTPAALVNSMNSVLNTLAAANPTKYASIQAPTTNGMTIQAAVVTTTTAAPASASSGTDNTLYIIIGVVGGVLLIAGVIAAVFIFTRSAPEAEHFESPGSVGLTRELIPMSMGNIDSETLELNDLHNLDEQGEIRQDRYAPA